MKLEDRLSTHLKDTSAKLAGRPPQVNVVVATAWARRVLARVLLGGGLLAAGLVVVGVMMAPHWGDDPVQATRVVVSPYAELDSRLAGASDEPVFIVTTDTPSYWRIASLNVYEDGIWKVAGDFSATTPRQLHPSLFRWRSTAGPASTWTRLRTP
jgi:hypothetical protein